MSFQIVLYQPEIPPNTGNIARTCAATGSRLHIIGPAGFEITDKHLKRAGLDYWHLLNVAWYDSIEEFFAKNQGTFYYATTKAKHCYSEVAYPDGCYLVFGKETEGLPEELLVQNPETCIRIPMREEARSLNLSNSVAVVLYEALRQSGFEALNRAGKLTKYEW